MICRGIGENLDGAVVIICRQDKHAGGRQRSADTISEIFILGILHSVVAANPNDAGTWVSGFGRNSVVQAVTAIVSVKRME